MAFISTAPTVLRSSFTSPSITSLSPSTTRAPQMALRAPEKPSAPFKTIEENRTAKAASEYRGPQGFTPYAEKVNGRLAQLGFVIGLVTEILTGKGMAQQMLIMFSPLTHAVENLLRITH